jgi:hypothetical protein
MCSLEGAGVLQDYFEKDGKPRVVVILRTPACEATDSPWRNSGAEGRGGPGVTLVEPEGPGVEFSRVLGGDGGRGSFWSSGKAGLEIGRGS